MREIDNNNMAEMSRVELEAAFWEVQSMLSKARRKNVAHKRGIREMEVKLRLQKAQIERYNAQQVADAALDALQQKLEIGKEK